MSIDLDHLFTYHPPSEAQALKYREIRAAQAECAFAFHSAHDTDESPAQRHDRINSACKAFAECILEHCPRSADRSAAIRCLRIARNAQNELIASRPHIESDAKALLRISFDELLKARWQACSAIALAE